MLPKLCVVTAVAWTDAMSVFAPVVGIVGKATSLLVPNERADTDLGGAGHAHDPDTVTGRVRDDEP
jgi:hypothetical protein